MTMRGFLSRILQDFLLAVGLRSCGPKWNQNPSPQRIAIAARFALKSRLPDSILLAIRRTEQFSPFYDFYKIVTVVLKLSRLECLAPFRLAGAFLAATPSRRSQIRAQEKVAVVPALHGHPSFRALYLLPLTFEVVAPFVSCGLPRI